MICSWINKPTCNILLKPDWQKAVILLGLCIFLVSTIQILGGATLEGRQGIAVEKLHYLGPIRLYYDSWLHSQPDIDTGFGIFCPSINSFPIIVILLSQFCLHMHLQN